MAKSKHCCESPCSFCVFVPIILIGLSPFALISVGMAVALPYSYIKHFSEEPTTCTVIGIEEKGSYSCDCGDDEFACFSKYPCTMIYVNYTDISTNNSELIFNATLFERPYNYYNVKQDGCSAMRCHDDEEGNSEYVSEFVSKYGTLGQQFPCYPGKSSDPEALLSVIYLWHVLLGLLLPATVLLVAGIGKYPNLNTSGTPT